MIRNHNLTVLIVIFFTSCFSRTTSECQINVSAQIRTLKNEVLAFKSKEYRRLYVQYIEDVREELLLQFAGDSRVLVYEELHDPNFDIFVIITSGEMTKMWSVKYVFCEECKRWRFLPEEVDYEYKGRFLKELYDTSAGDWEAMLNSRLVYQTGVQSVIFETDCSSRTSLGRIVGYSMRIIS